MWVTGAQTPGSSSAFCRSPGGARVEVDQLGCEPTPIKDALPPSIMPLTQEMIYLENIISYHFCTKLQSDYNQESKGQSRSYEAPIPR